MTESNNSKNDLKLDVPEGPKVVISFVMFNLPPQLACSLSNLGRVLFTLLLSPGLPLPSHATAFTKFMTSDENYHHHKREI
jgi:hypothetical protein